MKHEENSRLCFWAEKINLFYLAKQALAVCEGRQDMPSVWAPLFITSKTLSAYCQYSASSMMQLNSMTATGALSPGATASDLLSSCILSHLGSHH